MSDELSLSVKELEGKYLTFNLMEQFYGVNVDHILQIIGLTEITAVPKTPHFVKGVINYRGKIIPVVDLRLKFALPEQEDTEMTSIVIFKMLNNGDEVCIGITVDKVLEVLDIHAHEIEKAPVFGVELDIQFILGMAKVKQKVVTLLNIGKILLDADIARLVNQAQ